jgi:negative regulator of flagellin synthesis FlgM
MKIGPSPDNSLRVATTTQPAPQKGGKSASSTGTAAAANGTQAAGVAVTVSTLARTLEAAANGDAEEFNAEKVNAVRTAIQQGTYKVNAEAIADKLLANAQEMLDRSRK